MLSKNITKELKIKW